MVGSATYSKIDPKVPAMFSAPIVTDLLRGELGFDGVVITDDVNAEAVKATKPADRAVKVIEAGGDIVLTGDASTAPAMLAALKAKVAADPEFADQVRGLRRAGPRPQGPDGPAALLGRFRRLTVRRRPR